MKSLHEARSDELAQFTKLADEIYAGSELGCIARGVLDAEQVASLRARIDAIEPDAPRYEVVRDGYTLGKMLAPTALEPQGPDFEAYLRAASAFDAMSLLDLASTAAVESALSAFAGARPVCVPATTDRRRYAEATLHVFVAGDGAPAHCDSYPDLASHRHLKTVVDRTTQISWYLAVALPEQGGELTIYDLRHGEPRARDPGRAGALASTRYRVEPGDLIVFDGGRWFHRVEPCRGPTARRTLGGFAGLSRDREALMVWG